MECTTWERHKKKEKCNSLVDLCPPRRSSRFHRSSISSLARTNERLGVGFAPRTFARVGDFHSSSVILHRLTERIRFRYSWKRRTGEFDTEFSTYVRKPTACLSRYMTSRYMTSYTVTQFVQKKHRTLRQWIEDVDCSRSLFFLFSFFSKIWQVISLESMPSDRNYNKSLPRTLRQSDMALTRQPASLSKCLNIVGQKNKCMTRSLILYQGNNLQSSHPSTATSVPCTERSAEYRVYSRKCRSLVDVVLLLHNVRTKRKWRASRQKLHVFFESLVLTSV